MIRRSVSLAGSCLLGWVAMASVVAAQPAFEVQADPTGQVVSVKPVLSVPYRLGRISTADPKNFMLVLAVANPQGPPDIYFIPLNVGGPTPGPTPPVPPIPPTPPVPPVPPIPPPPVPTVLWGIVVEETKERTPAQAVVLLSPKVDALFKPAGQFRLVDPWDDTGALKPNIEPAMKPYAERATALKIKPCLFIVDPKGNVFFEGALPATVADVEALVAKIRKGGKP